VPARMWGGMLTKKDVTFTVEALTEYTQIEGNALVSGDDAIDKEAEDTIRCDLAWNIWAWCTVKVTATWKSLSADDYLGCCSYSSEADFMQGGYYDDMKAEALTSLNAQLQDILDAAGEL